MSSIKTGDKIPSFSLPDQNGSPVDAGLLIGKTKMVIFFYPKDDSPGCTREACYFRDLYEVFSDAGAVLIGISSQSVGSHKKFAEKYRLNYSILSDKGNSVRKLFGVPTSLFGLLPGRVTYIVDSKGMVAHIFNSQVQAERHVDEALKILKDLP